MAEDMPTPQLQRLLEPLTNSAGLFEQVTKDQQGVELQQSSGEFAVMRPGKFRWQTLLPFPQLLVSNGDSIWLYDPDLEQVTVKPFAGQSNQIPIRILSGEFELLENEFTVTRVQTEVHTSFQLLPTTDSGLGSVRLLFEDEELVQMSVTDQAQTVTEFVFSERRALTDSDNQSFTFVIPEGADVFYDQ